MLIQNFGLFWSRDEVDWQPGRGRPRHLWGRHHVNRPALRLSDCWEQHGLYVLYSFTGPYYVGIARKQAIGKRLADHTTDEYRNGWTRFSWFGFLPMTDTADAVCVPDKQAEVDEVLGRDALIADMEALLIKSMGTFNLNNMNFRDAREWAQVGHDDIDSFRRRQGLG